MSKLIRTGDRILTKLEMNNPGGSHKYRAAKLIIETALRSGKITPGITTVIEKTGGNFGFGLVAACHKHRIAVELAIGLGFSKTKRDLLECFGARLIGKDMLVSGASPRDVVNYHLEHQNDMGKSYYYTDQFNNPVCVEAHRYQTAAELACQLVKETAGKNYYLSVVLALVQVLKGSPWASKIMVLMFRQYWSIPSAATPGKAFFQTIAWKVWR
jgi:cysteine synthase